MAWTAPMTAADSTAFTAAQFNTHVRDNLLETMPAKALTVGDYFVSNGTNSITTRKPYTATVATSQSIGPSGSYGDLATAGPTLSSITLGKAAFIFVSAEVSNNANFFSLMGFDISGGLTLAAADSNAYGAQGTATTKFGHVFRIIPPSSPLTVTVTAKYRAVSDTGTFSNRTITLLNF